MAESAGPRRAGLLPGYLAGLAAVAIWAGWIVATRFAVTEAVDSALLAVFRYTIPALALAPVWLRRGLVPRGASLRPLILMTLGWGAPFVFWSAAGLETVPASLFGPIVPGLMPITVAFLAWAALGEPAGRGVRLGAALTAASVFLILGQWSAGGDVAALSGVPFLLMGMLGWAVYSVSFRLSGLQPIEATAYVALYSLPIVALAAAVGGDILGDVTPGEAAFHALMQGVVSGLGAVLAYGIALQRLGVQRASALIALVPVCTALMGWALLGETLTPLDWVAVAAASIGVAAANGVFARWIGAG